MKLTAPRQSRRRLPVPRVWVKQKHSPSLLLPVLRAVATMSHYHYDSDDSRADSRYTRRQRPAGRRRQRYRSPSEDSYHSPRRSYDDCEESSKQQKKGTSKYDTLGKASIAVGLLSVIAGFLQLWATKKSSDREQESRRERRREFERAKRQRRAEEARWEKQREWNEVHEPERETHSEMRSIAYRPARSRSRAPRRIEAPPPETRSGRTSRASSRAGYDGGYECDRRSRHG